jgi:hypothetical protein
MKAMMLAAIAVVVLGGGMGVTRMARPVSPVVCSVHRVAAPAVLVSASAVAVTGGEGSGPSAVRFYSRSGGIKPMPGNAVIIGGA